VTVAVLGERDRTAGLSVICSRAWRSRQARVHCQRLPLQPGAVESPLAVVGARLLDALGDTGRGRHRRKSLSRIVTVALPRADEIPPRCCSA